MYIAPINIAPRAKQRIVIIKYWRIFVEATSLKLKTAPDMKNNPNQGYILFKNTTWLNTFDKTFPVSYQNLPAKMHLEIDTPIKYIVIMIVAKIDALFPDSILAIYPY